MSLKPFAVAGCAGLLLAGCANGGTDTTATIVAKPSAALTGTTGLPLPVASMVPPGASSTAPKAADRYVDELRARRLPPLPHQAQWPTAAPGCTASLDQAGTRSAVLAPALTKALVATNSKPWAFVRADIDASGRFVNAHIERSAGFAPFDAAALATVSRWRIAMPPGRAGYVGCVAPIIVG